LRHKYFQDTMRLMRQKRQERQERQNGTDDNEQFLTTNEISEILRVHQRTVQRWISSNRLKATKVGPKILRVRKQDFDEFLESQSQDCQSDSET
jgi:excisionase family DNA binding protein